MIVDLITKLSERLTGGQHIQCGNTGQRHTPWPKRKGAGEYGQLQTPCLFLEFPLNPSRQCLAVGGKAEREEEC